MLKYQVRTLTRTRKTRHAAAHCFDKDTHSLNASSGSPSRGSCPTNASTSACEANAMDLCGPIYENMIFAGRQPGSVPTKHRRSVPASQSSYVRQSKASRNVSTSPGSSMSGSGSDGCGGAQSVIVPRKKPITSAGSVPLRRKGRSTSVSSLSSASTSSEPGLEWGTIRVYTYTIRPDSDYKTLFVNSSTTSGELLTMVMTKFKTKFKDPNLFYLSVEILTKHEGRTVETTLTLDPSSKPMDLQQYHPKDQLRFVLRIRDGVQIRVFDSDICPESNYKSILVSERTTCDEVINILVGSHKTTLPASALQLTVIHTQSQSACLLHPTDPVGTIVNSPWFDPSIHQIHIQRKPIEDFTVIEEVPDLAGRNILKIPISNYASPPGTTPSLTSSSSMESLVTPPMDQHDSSYPTRHLTTSTPKLFSHPSKACSVQVDVSYGMNRQKSESFVKSFEKFCAL